MRPPGSLPRLVLIASLAVVPGISTPTETPASSGEQEPVDDPDDGRFVYLRSGTPITFRASTVYAAALAPDTTEHRGLLTPPDGLELDPRGDRRDLVERGLTLFRVPTSVAPRGLDTSPPTDAWQAVLRSGLPAQPVFEQGAVLRIPSDEVVVGFETATTLDEAKRLLSASSDDLDVRQVREFRPGVFVCVLRNASGGRAFEASRKLAEADGVTWAEPSFLNVYLETPGGPPQGRTLPGGPASLTHMQTLESKYLGRVVSSVDRRPEGFVWSVAVDGHFENDIDLWRVAREEGSNRSLPVVVRQRTHEGMRSVYMSGKGLAGNTPPKPYREGASSYLISPVFDLAAYPDVFVELWFWARFEDPVDAPRRVHDLGRVLLYDVLSKEYVHEIPIAPVGLTGDLTLGPGTDRGWRKLMFRVPTEKIATPLQVLVHFYSDGLGESEGLFVDDIRVIYGTGDGGAPNARDPTAQRQYAIIPRGQIAGRPGASDPAPRAAAAWSAGIPEKKDVVVALLDDGVEPHPDLAFWKPEDDTEDAPDPDADEPADAAPQRAGGVVSGAPVGPEDRHGTACAGVLGAIAGNGVGIAGVAPGALLLPLHRGIDDLSVARAVDAAVELGADVLVIPWGWTGAAPEVVTHAIGDAIDAGLTVVAAAGDGVHRPYGDNVDYPCALATSMPVICVGASSISGEPKSPASPDGMYWWKSAESRAGPDLLAPGTWLHATDRVGPLGYNDGSGTVPSDVTEEFAGTGASACYAAGVAALMVSHDPELRPAELKRLITGSATKLPWTTTGRHDLRLVDPERAVHSAIESAAERVRPVDELQDSVDSSGE